MNPSTHDPSEEHPYFPSGDREGFYNDFRGGYRRVDMRMTLEFSGGTGHGSGPDPIGVYTWTGNYHLTVHTCPFIKPYLGAHSVA